MRTGDVSGPSRLRGGVDRVKMRARWLTRTRRVLLISIAWTTTSTEAAGHTGRAPIAILQGPRCVGTVVDTEYTITWLDSDQPIPTGTATVDLFFTSANPPTFTLSVVPPTLTGTAIVEGILEREPENRFLWDTRNVPTGSYWLWSRVNEPQGEAGAAEIITFSEGVLTIAHPGDPVPPAIVIKKPDTPYAWADRAYVLEFCVFDPDGSGHVTIEVTRSDDGTDLEAIAKDLPARDLGGYVFDTSNRAEGDWTIRATIEDARGLRFSAFARHFLLVTHLSLPDAGQSPAPGPDGSHDANIEPTSAEDAGRNAQENATSHDKCSCSAAYGQSNEQRGEEGWTTVGRSVLPSGILCTILWFLLALRVPRAPDLPRHFAR